MDVIMQFETTVGSLNTKAMTTASSLGQPKHGLLARALNLLPRIASFDEATPHTDIVNDKKNTGTFERLLVNNIVVQSAKTVSTTNQLNLIKQHQLLEVFQHSEEPRKQPTASRRNQP